MVNENYATDDTTGEVRFKERYGVVATVEMTANTELRIELRYADTDRGIEWYPNRHDLLEVITRLCIEAEEVGL